MVNEEILGGLKLALSKKESLKQAMMSFYNAGYKKEEIEEAARILQKEKFEQQKMQKSKPAQPIKKLQKPEKKTIQRVSKYGKPMKEQIHYAPKLKEKITSAIEKLKIPEQKVKTKTHQKISGYVKKPKQEGKLILLLLIFALLFLIGLLALVFFFREDLINFFNNLS